MSWIKYLDTFNLNADTNVHFKFSKSTVHHFITQ